MTAEEVIDFFAPHPSSVEAVMDWLVTSGIPAHRVSLSTNKQVRFGYFLPRLPHCLVDVWNANDSA